MVQEKIRELQNHYDQLVTLIRKACAMLDNCKRGSLIRKLEEFSTQPQIGAKKERLKVQVKEMTRELAEKSEEIRYFHTKQKQILNWIWILVGQLIDIIHKVRLFNKYGWTPPDAKESTILFKFNGEMKDILREIQKLLILVEPNIQMVVLATPGSFAMIFERIGEIGTTSIQPEVVRNQSLELIRARSTKFVSF